MINTARLNKHDNRINIQSGNLDMELCPRFGGCGTGLTYFKDGQYLDIFRYVDVDTSSGLNPMDSANFPLFPFSNRVVNGAFSYKGTDYTMEANMPPEPHTNHGCGWQSPAELLEQEDNRAKIKHVHPNEDYPFHFEAFQDYTINADDTIDIGVSIKNTGQKTMPFGTGIHPYFHRTADVQIKAQCDYVQINSKNMVPQSIGDIPDAMNFASYTRINNLILDNCYIGWDRKCSILWPEYGIELLITADDVFSNLVVYTPEGEDFFCVEPVTNIIDAHNNKLNWSDPGLVDLDYGQTLSGSIKFEFRHLDTK